MFKIAESFWEVVMTIIGKPNDRERMVKSVNNDLSKVMTDLRQGQSIIADVLSKSINSRTKVEMQISGIEQEMKKHESIIESMNDDDLKRRNQLLLLQKSEFLKHEKARLHDIKRDIELQETCRTRYLEFLECAVTYQGQLGHEAEIAAISAESFQLLADVFSRRNWEESRNTFSNIKEVISKLNEDTNNTRLSIVENFNLNNTPALRDNAVKSITENNSDIEKSLDLDKTLRQKEKYLADKEISIMATEKEFELRRMELDKAIAENAMLKDELTMLEKILKDDLTQLKEKQTKINDPNEMILALEKYIAESKDAGSLKIKIEALKEEMHKIGAENSALIAEVKEKSTYKDRAESKCEELRTQKVNLESKNLSLKDEKKRLKSAIEALGNETLELKNELEEMIKTKENSLSESKRIRESMAELEAELESKTQEEAKLSSSLKQAQSRLKVLDTKLIKDREIQRKIDEVLNGLN